MKRNIKKITSILFLIMFAIADLNAQYVNEAGAVKVDEIVTLLKSFEPLSHAQDSMSKAIIQSLLASTKTHPVLISDLDKKKAVFMTMVDIATPKGKFEFLTNRYKEFRKREESLKNDTVAYYINDLVRKYSAFEDSLNKIENQLIRIIESPLETNNSKREASSLLSRSNNLEIANYIFKNQSILSFYTSHNLPFDDDIYSEFWGADRGTLARFMYAKTNNTFPPSEEDKLKRNWLIFPFMINYWGNTSWCEEIDKKINPFSAELQIFWELTQDYKKPWLLYEFIEANAESKSTSILKDIEKDMSYRKSVFEQQEKNEKK